ncbi:Fic family protein [Pseudoalteromonas rhizosphaerae]|uniref:Fic family protein n=1 Tax=Pseudoalteromonas rhizosphaerae TaxID=2518973 RepID=UPI0012309D07|nr:Fic family protein [Pseudoalteromonas rhizosphaerae]
MITRPPSRLKTSPFQYIAENEPSKIDEYMSLFSPTDSKGRYLHFDEFKYRLPKGLDSSVSWSVLKMARERQLQDVFEVGDPKKLCKFYLSPTIQKAISETDRNTTNASLEWMCSKVGEEKHLEYLLNDLVEDEAISSSQLEGAATTTKVAKDLLKRKRKPRSPDEKMIVGNFKMMKFAWENRNEQLSIELILELHKIGVDNINNDNYTPGVFRKDDDVEVVDAEGNTVHTPPPAKGLTKRIKELSKWINICHHDIDNRNYFHPLVKAIALHFAIGYEHPFRDGNGRVARALFYWYMFKNDFAAFRYIAISVLLKTAPIQYGKSYLYTETDEMDLTYFLDYQCNIIIRAISQFKESYEKTLKETELFNKWLWESGLYKKLNDKQQTVFQVARGGVAQSFTAVNVKENLGCAYNTAANVLNGLVELKLFTKQKHGREWVYSICSPKKIVEDWKAR